LSSGYELLQLVIEKSGGIALIESSADALAAIIDYNDALESAVAASSSVPSLKASSLKAAPSGDDFPEAEALARLNNTKKQTGVAFSGGGSRSYVASAGYTQGLRDLGLWSKVKYAGGISGGNWFINSLSYRPRSFDTDVYLGPILPPEQNTLSALGKMPRKCMRGNAGRHFTLDMITALIEGNDPAEDWIQGVYDVYFKPAEVKWHAPYALDEVEAARIIEQNPDAGWDLNSFNYVTDVHDEPLPVVGYTLIGPVESAPFAAFSRQFTLVESTPIATGISHSMAITYTSRNGTAATMPTGGFVDSTFFGTNFLSSGSDTSVTVDATHGRGLWSLEQSAAASSMAPEAFFSLTTHRLADVLGFKARHFAPDSPDANTEILIGDGGSVEDINLIPLLKRGCKKIVLFLNMKDPLSSAEDYNPFSRLPRETDVESLLPSYFGVPAIPDTIVDWFSFFGVEFNKNKVFRSFHYPFLVKELQKAQATGNGAVATMKLTTVDNDWWGVKGGENVEITWVYLSKSEAFNSQLPEEVRVSVDTGDNDPQVLPPDGPFQGFPHFGTSGADINAEQSNLLANYCGWIVKQNEELFRKALE
jgi:hypothetical protein